jgi:hypothetical protein
MAGVWSLPVLGLTVQLFEFGEVAEKHEFALAHNRSDPKQIGDRVPAHESLL